MASFLPSKRCCKCVILPFKLFVIIICCYFLFICNHSDKYSSASLVNSLNRDTTTRRVDNSIHYILLKWCKSKSPNHLFHSLFDSHRNALYYVMYIVLVVDDRENIMVRSYFLLSDGRTSPLELEGWRDKLNANSRLQGTTKWTIDRHAPISVARSEDQASAPAHNQAQEYLMAVFDKYKYVKDHELMRNFMVKFEGMDGTDRGGLSREFFYLTFEACISGTYKGSSLMIGERGRLIPTNDDNLMDAFRCIGMMIAHAVHHGCRGLHGLSPAIKYYLVRGQGLSFIENDCPPVSIDDVHDEKLYNLLAKVWTNALLIY